MPLNGVQAALEVLAGFGVRYLFGNPGTTELPLSDAMAAERRIRYILGLQEVPVVAMADGYAQASGSVGVVNLHICCGLGNAMGMIYNAYREHSPLVITAGQQDQRFAFEEPILWGRMVDVARPWTKWAEEIRRAEDVPSAFRRAVQTALTPPRGPVFLALPLDVQTAEVGEQIDLRPPSVPSALVAPDPEALDRGAAVLASAENPGILAGNRIAEAEAVDALVAVAERLGAPVMHEASTSHGRCAFPSTHPLAAPALPFWSPEVRRRLDEFDVVLVAGMKLPQLYIYHEPARAVPEHVRLVQIDDDAWQLGKNDPVEVGLLGHPRVALEQLAARLDRAMTAPQREAARRRGRRRAETLAEARRALRAEAESLRGARPSAAMYLMETLARVLPDDVAVVEEAPTTTMGCYFERAGALKNTDGYFAQRGWALGWGLGCAIGVKLAWPDRPVLALIGDGAAMYGVQGLWTAAHYRIPVTFVLCNNRQYKILKDCARVLRLPEALAGRYEGLDLVDPAIDYVALGRSLGVEAERFAQADALAEAVAASLAEGTLRLFEIEVGEG